MHLTRCESQYRNHEPRILALLTHTPLLVTAARQIAVLSLLLFVYSEARDLDVGCRGGCTMCSVGLKPQLRPSRFKSMCHPQTRFSSSSGSSSLSPEASGFSISGLFCVCLLYCRLLLPIFHFWSFLLDRKNRCSWLTPVSRYDPYTRIILRNRS